jgi:DNA-binding MarR family transcriptional regulator
MMPVMTTSLRTTLDLMRARTLVLRDIDHALGAYHGIGLNDLALLLEVRDAPGRMLRRSDLAARLAVTTSGIARQLGPLERMGLVTREPNPGDARLALVSLTDAGQRLVTDAAASAEELAEQVLGRYWSSEHQAQLAGVLEQTRHPATR